MFDDSELVLKENVVDPIVPTIAAQPAVSTSFKFHAHQKPGDRPGNIEMLRQHDGFVELQQLCARHGDLHVWDNADQSLANADDVEVGKLGGWI